MNPSITVKLYIIRVLEFNHMFCSYPQLRHMFSSSTNQVCKQFRMQGLPTHSSKSLPNLVRCMFTPLNHLVSNS